MESPCLVTAEKPRLPLKRARELPKPIQPGGALTLRDSTLTLQLNHTLEVADTRLGVAPALTEYLGVRHVFQPYDLGVPFFRIPFILSLRNGSILVGADARFEASNDFGPAGVVLAISKDGGLSFPAKFLAIKAPTVTKNSRVMDPCCIEAPNGDLFLFTVYFQNENHVTNADPDYDFYMSRSTDGGYTWGELVSLKALFNTAGEKYFFQCPGNGIVMSDGTMVVPCQAWLSSGRYRSTIIFSKDLGKTWERATSEPAVDTTEACVAELTTGTLMLIAKREGSANNVNDRVRAVYTTTDLGTNWEVHGTSNTLRMRNPCQGSCYTLTYPGRENCVLFCSPLIDNSEYSTGRSYLTLQLYRPSLFEWQPFGVVESANTWGYTGITVDPASRRLYVVTEIKYGQNIGISVYDCSRFWADITRPVVSNVNLGRVVEVFSNACTATGSTALKYRLDGPDIYLAGVLLPPTSGTFPSTLTDLFKFPLPNAVSTRTGWITCFGSKSQPGAEFFAFPIEYRCDYANKQMIFRCFNNTSVAGTALSAMTIIYIPDTKIAIMC